MWEYHPDNYQQDVQANYTLVFQWLLDDTTSLRSHATLIAKLDGRALVMLGVLNAAAPTLLFVANG